MNCCDANGKCRCAMGNPLPLEMIEDPASEGAPTWMDALGLIGAVAALLAIGFMLGRVTA